MSGSIVLFETKHSSIDLTVEKNKRYAKTSRDSKARTSVCGDYYGTRMSYAVRVGEADMSG